MKTRTTKRVKEYRLCPEDCIYRNKLVNFCGVCLKDIMEERKKKDGQSETEGLKQTGGEGL